MTAHVYYSVDKIFALSESIQVWFWHNKGILTTSFGINAKSQCRGTSRLDNNEMTEQVFMCEAIDSEGKKFISEFNSLKGNDTAGVQKFSIVSLINFHKFRFNSKLFFKRNSKEKSSQAHI